jgi:hypothetical protein
VTTELNIKIVAETAEDAMMELATISLRAAQELGVVPQANDPKIDYTAPVEISGPNREILHAEKTNGAEPPPAKAVKAKPTKKAAPAPTPEPEPEPEPEVDRETVLDGLTKLYGGGDPKIRKAITAFRDDRGAERLRDLKDEDIPEAGALLVALRAEAAAAP